MTPPAGQPPIETVTVSKDQFNDVVRRLDAFDRQFNFQATQQQPPPGPSVGEQVAELDRDINALDTQIDASIADEKPISELLSKRSSLEARKLRLQIQHEDIAPIRDTGITALEQLSATVTRSEMPHYDLVEREMNTMISTLPPDQRANPQVRKKAYEMAVGANLDKIISAEREKILREAATQTTQDASSTSSRTDGSSSSGIPAPKDVLSQDALNALRMKGQSVDAYYKTLGYDSWEDFYTKNKDYFEEIQ